jgi:hypothetical protein
VWMVGSVSHPVEVEETTHLKRHVELYTLTTFVGSMICKACCVGHIDQKGQLGQIHVKG